MAHLGMPLMPQPLQASTFVAAKMDSGADGADCCAWQLNNNQFLDSSASCCSIEHDLLNSSESLSDAECEQVSDQGQHLPPVAYSCAASIDIEVYSHQLDGECVLRSSARGSFAESTPSIEWMHDVAVSYQLQSSTFFLAVAVLDCFLSLSPVPPRGAMFQFLALTCLMLAGKAEEETGRQRSADDWLQLIPGASGAPAFTRMDLSCMEVLVWSTLNHRLIIPTVHSFLQLLVPLLGFLSPMSDDERQAIARRASHLSEVTALKASFQRYKPSVNASACLLLAEYFETLGSCPMRSTASRWPAEQADVQDCADSGPYRGAHDADQEALTLLANQASFTTDALRCLLTRVLKVPAMALGECMQELHLAASVC